MVLTAAGAVVVAAGDGVALVARRVLVGEADAATEAAIEPGVTRPGALATVRIGRNAGRAARLAATVPRGAGFGTSSRAAAFIRSATTAQPATPSDAAPAAIIRPVLMGPVCPMRTV